MRTRIRSKISKVEVRRLIEAARKAGMQIGSLEVRPDGSIVIGAATTVSGGHDVFEQWASRL